MEKLKEKIIEAVLEHNNSDTAYGIGEWNPNLEDVLIAIFPQLIFIDTVGGFRKPDSPAKVECKWQLGKSLDQQPKEVIKFLEEILL